MKTHLHSYYHQGETHSLTLTHTHTHIHTQKYTQFNNNLEAIKLIERKRAKKSKIKGLPM